MMCKVLSNEPRFLNSITKGFFVPDVPPQHNLRKQFEELGQTKCWELLKTCDPISAKKIGATPVKIKEKKFKIDIDDLLAKISNRTKIIFIANPNNPTGSYLNNNEITTIISKVRKDILIVLEYKLFIKNKLNNKSVFNI